MRRTKNAGFSLPLELMEQIDRERGDVSRSRYIQRMLQKACAKEILQQPQEHLDPRESLTAETNC